MPFAGTRINQETVPLDAGGMTGTASYYEVKFTDTTKPNGQIWAGVVGDANVNAPRGQRNERWFVVWLPHSTSVATSSPASRPACPPPFPVGRGFHLQPPTRSSSESSSITFLAVMPSPPLS